MGSLNRPPELSLEFKPTFIPKTITEFLGEVSRIESVSEKISQVDDIVGRLEAETRKIEAFKRELPLCMLLINDAIAALKEESMVFKKSSIAKPVLEEFIPLKKSGDEDVESEIVRKERDNGDKKNWLSSTQLWNANENNPSTNQSQNQKQNSLEQIVKKRAEEGDVRIINDLYQPCRNYGREFIPFKGYGGFTVVGTRKEDKEEMPVSGLSLITPGTNNPTGGNGLLTKTSANSRLVPCFTPIVQSNIRTAAPQPRPPQQQTGRKQRRCWSTELHRRFVSALQQLGGSQVATPKQIRELMQVDDLTNDEVKSHLQKYRLHTRKVPSSNTSSTNQSGVVLGGGSWMPPQDQYVESSKHSNSQSGSPDGPLLNGTSTTGGDSMDDAEEEKSENYCWNAHLHTSGKDAV